MCERAGLVKLGHVGLDGSKMKANAKRYRNRRYEKLEEEEQALEQEVKELLRSAEEADVAEDKQYGRGQRGDELPADLARRASRLQKIRAAKASLEQESRERAERKNAEKQQRFEVRQEQAQERGGKVNGRLPQMLKVEEVRPKPNSAGNLTESRIPFDARWSYQEFRAGLQCASGSRWRKAHHRGGRRHSGCARPRATSENGASYRAKSGTQAGSHDG